MAAAADRGDRVHRDDHLAARTSGRHPSGEQAEGPLPEFVDGLADCQPLLRIPGTAVFLNRGKQTAPLAMRANVKHNYALHEHVVIVPIDTVPVPRVPDSERTEVDPLGLAKDGIFHVTTHFGYMETPNVRRTPPARPDPDRRPDRRRRGILFPIQARADEGDGTDHGALAQSTCSSPMPPTTSACPPNARSSWVRGSRSRFRASYRVGRMGLEPTTKRIMRTQIGVAGT
jgi:hypothetical protein